MKKHECFKTQIAGMPISLVQRGKDNFTVIYWKQVKEYLTYGQAASELGSCIMHALACEGQLDNGYKD